MIRHIHKCACGAFYACTQAPDQCPIKHWDCPVCEDKALDDHFAASFDNLRHSHPTSPKEQTREYQQRVS